MKFATMVPRPLLTNSRNAPEWKHGDMKRTRVDPHVPKTEKVVEARPNIKTFSTKRFQVVAFWSPVHMKMTENVFTGAWK